MTDDDNNNNDVLDDNDDDDDYTCQSRHQQERFIGILICLRRMWNHYWPSRPSHTAVAIVVQQDDNDDDDDDNDNIDQEEEDDDDDTIMIRSRWCRYYYYRTITTITNSSSILSVSLFFNVIFIVLFAIQAHRYILSSSSSSSTTTTTATTTTNCNNDNRSSTTATTYSKLQEKYMVTNMTYGVVASDQGRCSQMAVDIILHQYNGTAIDATIFIALCLGIMNPASSGLGGGAFILLHHIPNHQNYFNDNNNDKYRLKFYDKRTFKTTKTNNQKLKINEVIDCRERAPMLANTTMYNTLPSNASVYGTYAIPIMGELHCLYIAHYRFGTISWSQLLQPIIDMSNHGIVVGSYLATQIHDTATHHIKLEQQQPSSSQSSYNIKNEYDSLRQLLTHNNNWSTPLQVGDVMYNKELGHTLQQIAKYGINAIYQPPMATTIANEIQSLGRYNGIITTEDYQNYRPTIYTPIYNIVPIHGYTIMSIPPPSSGGVTIIGALRFLINNITIPLASYMDTITIHTIIEACKHVFSIRMSLSDPDYNTSTVQDVVHDLIVSSTYMEQLRQKFYNDTTTLLKLSLYGGTKWSLLNDTEVVTDHNITDAKEGDRQRSLQNKEKQRKQHQQTADFRKDHRQQSRGSRGRKEQRTFGYLNDHGTSHFSVVDQYGNAVAMTTSINTIFGSHVRSPSTGIIFSNTMDDFSKPDVPNHYGLKPSVSNYIQPMKRPLSSMSPTMVFRHRDSSNNNDDDINNLGDLVLVIGASGGPKIITAVLQVIIRIIYLGQNIFDAILHPRIHNQLIYHGSAITATERAKIMTSSKVTKAGSRLDDDRLEYDINISERTRAALQRRNHELIDIDFSGTVQAICIDYETTITNNNNNNNNNRPILSGVSDPRKDGQPAGY